MPARYTTLMQVRVLFFGMLRDVAGKGAELVTLEEGATVADLLAHYQSKLPRLRIYLPSSAVSINREYAAADAPLHDADEVALLPPVSGGAPSAEPDSVAVRPVSRAALVPHKIDSRQVISAIQRPADGALVVFEGVVRDNSRGRRTLYLDYEAYDAMALQQLEDLAAQALAKFDIRDAVIVHRLGRLEIGETSVLVVVASAHRAPAFEACRWLIDTLKKTVPIWKKEYFEDGAIWAAGEPFPAELAGKTSTGGQSKRRGKVEETSDESGAASK